ncbi:MAG: fatty acid desaturase, partial [Planctomycetales bacterium]
NELVSDLLCMFPLFATTDQYRLIHLGHHQFVNDWDKDPELINLGKTRSMDKFPMTRGQFIYHYYLRMLGPPVLLRYMWDNIWVTALGKCKSTYLDDEEQRTQPKILGLRVTTLLGLAYAVGLVIAVRLATGAGLGLPGYLGIGLGGWLLACGMVAVLPRKMFYLSPFTEVYSHKFNSVMRLGYFTGLITMLGILTWATGFDWRFYFWALWILPLFTTFPYLMLIRDIYQHANADDGKLTNSRVFFCDPLTRWGLFIYGQGVHLTHHLFPLIPHYNLMKLHHLLQENNTEYAQYAVECHGVFSNRVEQPTILDVMEIPTCEPQEILDHHASSDDPA